MFSFIKNRLSEPTTLKGSIAISGAVLMYFTPDAVDSLIMVVLGSLGITDILTIEKRSKESEG